MTASPPSAPVRVAVMASGGGTNLQSLLDALNGTPGGPHGWFGWFRTAPTPERSTGPGEPVSPR